MSFLSKSLLTILLPLLDDASKGNATFNALSSRYKTQFKESEQFKAGMALSFLIQDPEDLNLLSTSDQKLMALFILWDAYAPIVHNPFSSVLIDWLVDDKHTDAERQLVLSLTGSEDDAKIIRQQTPTQYRETVEVNVILYDELALNSNAAFRHLRKSLDEKQKELLQVVPPLWAQSLPAYVPNSAKAFDSVEQISKRLCNFYEVEFVRSPPALLPVSAEELEWISWPHIRPFLWDKLGNSGLTQSRKVDKSLMAKALKISLSNNETKQLLSELSARKEEDLPRKSMPLLVEKNPLIATQVLVKNPHYLPMLLHMDLSLHSVEVVNNLTNAKGVVLPQDFLRLFVSHAFASCEKITDQYLQGRLVRLVCVFVQRLIRNKTIDTSELFVEVQQFCIQFSRFKDAANLFRLLKNTE